MRNLRRVFTKFARLLNRITSRHSECDELAFMEALARGRERDVVQFLVQGFSPNHYFSFDATPLTTVVISEEISVDEKLRLIGLLVEKGAKVDLANERGHTALMLACHESDPRLLSSLLDLGANPNLTDVNGDSPLIWGVSCGHLPSMRVLLERGSKVNHANNVGQTALMYASRNGNEVYVRELIAAGARRELKTRDGADPLMLACEGNHRTVVELLLDGDPERRDSLSLHLAASVGLLANVQGALQRQEDPGWRNAHGMCSLDLAITYHHGDVVELLLSRPWKPHDLSHALGVACLARNESALKLLLEKGADPNWRDEIGDTPLALAVGRNWAQGVEALMVAGGDENRLNDAGDSPIDRAQRDKNYDALQAIFRSRDRK